MQAKAQTSSQSGARPAYGRPSKKPRLDFAGFWIRAGAYAVDLFILFLVWHFVLSPVLEGRSGQTLGKKALNLRVVTPDGDRIGYIKAFVRYVGKVVSWIILGIGFIMAAFDGEKRALHDRMCETRVVRE